MGLLAGQAALCPSRVTTTTGGHVRTKAQPEGMVPDSCAPSGTWGRKVWDGGTDLLSDVGASNAASDSSLSH